MNPREKRRFIAGAVCPRCSAMDTIVMFHEDDLDVRQCVECDFEERTNFSADKSVSISAAKKELPTRVNAPIVNETKISQEKNAVKDEIAVIKIIGGLSPDKNPTKK